MYGTAVAVADGSIRRSDRDPASCQHSRNICVGHTKAVSETGLRQKLVGISLAKMNRARIDQGLSCRIAPSELISGHHDQISYAIIVDIADTEIPTKAGARPSQRAVGRLLRRVQEHKDRTRIRDNQFVSAATVDVADGDGGAK